MSTCNFPSDYDADCERQEPCPLHAGWRAKCPVVKTASEAVAVLMAGGGVGIDLRRETALERAEREELEHWGAAQLQEQEDRKFVLQQALGHYVADFASADQLGPVAARRLAVAKKLLGEACR